MARRSWSRPSKKERRERRARRIQAASYALLLAVILSLVGFIEKDPLIEQWRWSKVTQPYIAKNIAPYLLTAEREKGLKPADTFRECNENCPEMVVIPAGTFVMGSPDGETSVIGLDGKPKPGVLAPKEEGRRNDEGPQHEVRIAHPFAVGRYAVTFEEWDECNAGGACPFAPDSGYGRGRHPVINVSWEDAQKYATWLSTMTGRAYRLPSEAEWEYAARAGTNTAYSFGDTYPPSKKICEHANFADISLDVQVNKRHGLGWKTSDICDDGEVTPAPVGSYKPNGFGLYDMHGNVFQWTADCYADSYNSAPNDGRPIATKDCGSRVARGGSWSIAPEYLRSAYRDRATPGYRIYYLGFRVGRTLKQ